jgi:hypothetical protein
VWLKFEWLQQGSRPPTSPVQHSFLACCFFTLAIMASQTNGHGRRPSAASRFPTAPSVMTMNGHFAGVGDAPTKEQYEHGIQVIDEDKSFKYAAICQITVSYTDEFLVRISTHTCSLPKSHNLASTTISSPSLAPNPQANLLY